MDATQNDDQTGKNNNDKDNSTSINSIQSLPKEDSTNSRELELFSNDSINSSPYYEDESSCTNSYRDSSLYNEEDGVYVEEYNDNVYNENSDGNVDECNIQKTSNASGKIFVGGLLKTTSNESLRDYFSEFGVVKESIVIKATEKSNKSRGFGFVTFADPTVIDSIFYLEHLIEGKRVEIRKAIPKEDMIEEPKKQKLFVGGLPKHTTPDDFKSYFSDYGEVLEYNLLTEKNGSVKGFGFVCFKDENINETVLNETHFILGKRVDVRIADSQNKRIAQQAMMGNHPANHMISQYPLSNSQKPFFFFQHQNYPPSSSVPQSPSNLIPSPPHHQSPSPTPQYQSPYSHSPPPSLSSSDQTTGSTNNNSNNCPTQNDNNHQQQNNVNQKHFVNSPTQNGNNTSPNHSQYERSTGFHHHSHQSLPIQPEAYEIYHGYEPFCASNQNSYYSQNVVMVPVLYPYPYPQDPHSSKYYQSMYPCYNRYYPHQRAINVISYPPGTPFESSPAILSNYSTNRVSKANSYSHNHNHSHNHYNNHNNNRSLNNDGNEQNNGDSNKKDLSQ
ncbi:hypothetical protein DICPUDRAFT_78661 [Dictyostelium purpureum]|uniref:RRM domain-containing protein n=1 Tax=Dictyostelium purpureum TaxID=5786 RepID=F0ZK64_DICPU|nr:uncharacterized protein DICPUDRAFT_78661 [Dictyostelium purpureum]EGC35667.1 hypothetical protein DICPUDRAFT_78661 [Dictyostelium purpureum]|eukprot:XP_003287800.1 hypothetical protein DICPUDRAFT_78661 [Dictyostelium purpureum]